MEEGDVFYLHVLGKKLAYEVDQILTVLPEQTESLGITDGDDYVTLVTCTPYAVNTHRLLVRGHRVPMKAAKAVQKAEKKVTGITNPTLPMLALCVVIGIVIAVILVAGINSVQNKNDAGNDLWLKEKKKKSNVVLNIIIALVFLAGAGVFLYPTISDMWNQYRNAQLVSKYEEAVTELSDNDYDRLWKEAKEYNAEHPVNAIVDAFEEEDTYELSHPYDRVLDRTVMV